MIISTLLNRESFFICSWSRTFALNRSIFTIWYFWLENGIFSRRIELLLPKFLKIIYTWSWIRCPCHSVMFHIMLFENFSCNFTFCKVMNKRLLLYCSLFRIICRWPHSVIIPFKTIISGRSTLFHKSDISSVCCRSKFFRRNTWCFSCRNYC